WRVESRYGCLAVNEARHAVSRNRVDDKLPATLSEAANRMIIRVGEVKRTVGGDKNFIGIAESRLIGCAIAEAFQAFFGGVQLLLVRLRVYRLCSPGNRVNGNAGAAANNAAHHIIAIFGYKDGTV